MKKILLNSYRPLCSTAYGRKAVNDFQILPYVDGSCRREPDFESRFPSITALCRGQACAPRLNEGDIIVYMTVKHNYEKDTIRHRRLVAILEVFKRFESHKEGAEWYLENKRSLPSNCLVANNPPLNLEYTVGFGYREMRRIENLPSYKREKIKDLKLRAWDKEYWEVVMKYPVFLVTQQIYLELNHPPKLYDTDFENIFGKVPATRTPPSINQKQFDGLFRLISNMC